MSDHYKYGLVLGLLVLLCFFWGLDTKPLFKIQELRVAETAREMVASGDWVVPTFNGELRLRKPPLPYWVAATSYKVFGAVNEFTARFGSAIFASLSAVALFAWLRKMQGNVTAFVVALCFISTYLGIRYSRNAETDSMLLFFIILACNQAEEATSRQARLFYLFMGLGFLSKGPAAVAIPLLLWIALAWRNKQFVSLRKLADPMGIAVFLVTAFAWYGVIFFKVPDMAAHWVAEEIDATYITGKHQEPLYYYALNMWKFFAPWSIFLIPAAWAFYKQRERSPLTVLAWLWLALTFIILTLNPSKQVQYALLLNAPIALVVGLYLGTAEGRFAVLNRALLLAGSLGVVLIAMALLYKRHSQTDIAALWIPFAMAAVPIALIALMRTKKVPYPVLVLGSLVIGATLYNQTHMYAISDDRFEVEAKEVAESAKPYTPLYAYGRKGYGIAPATAFYIQRVVPVVEDDAQLQQLTADLKETIYLVSEHTPAEWHLPNVDAERLLQRGDYALWRLTPRSQNTAIGMR
jgi:4-amino-4-deoxy-L-arabinose transferase-like glycosyltransferase